ncbi:MAG TPA: hypothetical protein VIO81_02705 [Methyloversatilis sp.]
MKNNDVASVLIVGCAPHLMLAASRVFSLAKLTFDCVSTKRTLKGHRFIRYFEQCSRDALVDKVLSAIRENSYKAVILSDDRTINLILDSNLSVEDKLALLPVVSVENFSHLSSKIGLARIFEQYGIKSPDFAVVETRQQLSDAVLRMGFPLIIKGDRSGGGKQTLDILNESDLSRVLAGFDFFPAILQRKVAGDLIGIEAFYQDRLLISFSYSEVLQTTGNEFSPSVLRHYHQTGSIDPSVQRELEDIGRALGADGFANISCILTEQNERHYFEADMRPTAWVAHSSYFGDDLASKIRTYLMDGIRQENLSTLDERYPATIELPLFIRMRPWEILINRYSVWKYIYFDSAVARIYLRSLRSFLRNALTLKSVRRHVRDILAPAAPDKI